MVRTAEVGQWRFHSVAMVTTNCQTHHDRYTNKCQQKIAFWLNKMNLNNKWTIFDKLHNNNIVKLKPSYMFIFIYKYKDTSEEFVKELIISQEVISLFLKGQAVWSEKASGCHSSTSEVIFILVISLGVSVWTKAESDIPHQDVKKRLWRGNPQECGFLLLLALVFQWMTWEAAPHKILAATRSINYWLQSSSRPWKFSAGSFHRNEVILQ